jgi:hypothetical protein
MHQVSVHNFTLVYSYNVFFYIYTDLETNTVIKTWFINLLALYYSRNIKSLLITTKSSLQYIFVPNLFI